MVNRLVTVMLVTLIMTSMASGVYGADSKVSKKSNKTTKPDESKTGSVPTAMKNGLVYLVNKESKLVFIPTDGLIDKLSKTSDGGKIRINGIILVDGNPENSSGEFPIQCVKHENIYNWKETLLKKYPRSSSANLYVDKDNDLALGLVIGMSQKAGITVKNGVLCKLVKMERDKKIFSNEGGVSTGETVDKQTIFVSYNLSEHGLFAFVY